MDVIEILTALNAPEGKADPYPHYATLHELGEAASLGPGGVLVYGYDALSTVLRDPAFRHPGVAGFDASLPGWREHPSLVQGQEWILYTNAPEHTRIRNLMARVFTARRVAGLEPAIARMTDRLLDGLADRGADGGAVEFMHDFAFLLPVTVICELIGIPEADREGFRPIARALATTFEFASLDDLADADAAALKLNGYFTDLIAARRPEPRDDLLSDLVAILDAGDGRLSDSELLGNLTLLLIAGFETTTNLLGNGLRIILQDPQVRAAVGDGSVPVAAFVEEVLRYDSPVQIAPSRRRRRRRGGRRAHHPGRLHRAADRRREPGPAPVRPPGQVRPDALRGRAAQLRRRRALLPRRRPGPAGGRGSVPADPGPLPGAGRGRRAAPQADPGAARLRQPPGHRRLTIFDGGGYQGRGTSGRPRRRGGVPDGTSGRPRRRGGVPAGRPRAPPPLHALSPFSSAFVANGAPSRPG